MNLGVAVVPHYLDAAVTERLLWWSSAAVDAKLGKQTEQLHDLAGPSIMHETLQTAAEATRQPVAAPPVRCSVLMLALLKLCLSRTHW